MQPSARPVPRRRFDRRSPRFQRGAFTRLAYEANWCGQGESNARLIVGNDEHYHYAMPALLVGRGRNRTSCHTGTAFTAQRRHQPVLIGTSQNWKRERELHPRPDAYEASELLLLHPAFKLWR
jgi:hypothetical protein